MINYDAFVVEVVPANAYMVAIDDGVFMPSLYYLG